jgi:hypothetical protein
MPVAGDGRLFPAPSQWRERQAAGEAGASEAKQREGSQTDTVAVHLGKTAARPVRP